MQLDQLIGVRIFMKAFQGEGLVLPIVGRFEEIMKIVLGERYR